MTTFGSASGSFLLCLPSFDPNLGVEKELLNRLMLQEKSKVLINLKHILGEGVKAGKRSAAVCLFAVSTKEEDQ